MVLIRRSVTVNMGIVGPGAAWETRYRPALEKLAERIRVAAVFDAVAARAEQVARECDAKPVQGLLQLVHRPDVDAVMFLDASWHGIEALRMLCSANKPVFIAAEIGDDISSLRACHWTAVSYGLTLMPEFGWRYTPATGRLQELVATRLGRVCRVRADADLSQSSRTDPVPAVAGSDDRRYLMGMFDWCRYLMRTSPDEIASLEHAGGGNGAPISRLHVKYPPRRNGGTAPTAEMRLRHTPAEAAPERNQNGDSGEDRIQFEVECETGSAVIESPCVIHWKTDDEQATETLATERNEVEVMLDHFCRRVVGGLVPVSDLADVYHGLDLLAAAEQSHRTGKAVEVNGRVFGTAGDLPA